ncbi:flavin oxidoreductase [Brumimicrobium salinarum]|uniref:Flavin oxidoreductase n=2 Tax=Brumimicrobium salinarum TaxID=2058658 RepID=A0A2I0R6Y8_9FLAO|nr:flavin oxidoreductase [Brumimicrobium salinarum]
MEKRVRTNLINCLSGVKSLNLIGTKDEKGQNNLAIFNSVIHLGAHPPIMGFIQRPTSVERHTYENIKSTGYFTINAVSTSIHQQAHQTAARYAKSESEFEEVSLTEKYITGFHAPFVEESPIKIGLKCVDIIEIPVNNTKLIVGEIQLIELDENSMEKDGFLSLPKHNVVGGNGLDSYLSISEIDRYSYAKPDQFLKTIK